MLSIQAENAISGDNMSYLLIEPSGNGEANMIPLTMTVIATTYLDKTKQWEKLGFDKRSEALRYIEAGEWDLSIGDLSREFAVSERGLSCVQATVINLWTVKVMDHFPWIRITQAAPGKTPPPPTFSSGCTFAACLLRGLTLFFSWKVDGFCR